MSMELIVRDKVQRFTREVFDIVMLDDDGDLSIPYESTRVFISVIAKDLSDPDYAKFCRENGLAETLVYLRAIVLFDVKRTPQLYEWVANQGSLYDFGNFSLRSGEDADEALLLFEYTIAGDNLDPVELKNALLMVATTADAHDEKLQEMFGGQRVEDL